MMEFGPFADQQCGACRFGYRNPRTQNTKCSHPDTPATFGDYAKSMPGHDYPESYNPDWVDTCAGFKPEETWQRGQ